MKPTGAGPSRRYLPGSPFNVPVVEEPVEVYARQDLVTHDKYGFGTVLDVEGQEDQTAVFVDFGNQRVRLALPCAKLSRL